METEKTSATHLLVVLGLFIILVGLSAVIPARWFGVKPKTPTVLNFDNIQAYQDLRKDKNNNNTPDWKDLLQKTVIVSTTTLTEEEKGVEGFLNDPNNLTTSFSKNMLVASSYLESNNQTSEEAQQQMTDVILQQEKSKIVIVEYTLHNLNIKNDESLASKKAYGNALGALMQEATSYGVGAGDLDIIKAYGTNKDASMLTSITIKKNKLEALLIKMLAMPVPVSASVLHLYVINKLSVHIAVLNAFSTMNSDPIKANLMLNEYIPSLNALANALSSLWSYFSSEKITFTSKEAGYVFMPEYTKQ